MGPTLNGPHRSRRRLREGQSPRRRRDLIARNADNDFTACAGDAHATDAIAMDMLQDYASDDDDDTTTTTTIAPAAPAPEPAAPAAASSSATPIPPAAPLPAPSSLLLPSAAELFDAAPPARNKRPQVNGSAHPSQHQPKVARSSSSSSAPRTPPGATLVPPQLRGRSNVATEDLDKLFVQRQQRRSE